MKEITERKCLHCNCLLFGRSDQKFCNDNCRNNYNNEINRERNNEKNKNRYHENKEYRDRMMITRNIRDKERRESDPLFKLTKNIRTALRNSLKRKGYIKNSRTEEILGCSFDEFKSHLENQFESWMSWDNYGLYNGLYSYGWDIDHITKLSSGKTESEIISLNHYTNLQPLCSHINRDIKI
jgi:hypothetical protein